MLTFKKAVFAALLLLSCLYLLRSSRPTYHSTDLTEAAAAAHKSARSSTDAVSKAAKKPAEAVQEQAPLKGEESKENTENKEAAKEDKEEKKFPVYKKKGILTEAEIEQLSHKPLRERIKEVFAYNPKSKFPAYIWQTWKVTPASGQFGEDNRPREASWTENHPGFVHKVIDDETALPFLKYLYAAFPEVIEAYQSFPKSMPVLKADFFRYLILLARGGIYTDMDTFVLKPAMDWVPKNWDTREYGLVIGIEADAADRPDWHDWYSRAIQFCQWTILSKPGHPALQDVVANITQEVLAMKERHLDTLETDEETGVERLTVTNLDKSVVELTGPAVWTDSVFRHLNSDDIYILDKGKRLHVTPDIFHALKTQKLVGDVVVLPITSFSPGVGQMGAENDDSDMAFVKHEFDGTWKPHEDEDSENEDDKKASAEASPSPAS